MAEESAAAGPLAGLVVVDLSRTVPGVQASQLFSDYGAEVIHVEPPGGSALRSSPAYPFLARSKLSIELDLHDAADAAVAGRLASRADVVIETFRPGVAERLGLGYEQLSAENPRLVYGSISGFGRRGPLAHVKGYEGIVVAKLGGMSAVAEMSRRPGPSFLSAPYAGFPASQLLAQGILAALYERETSGLGQRVDTTMAQGLSVHDTFNWFARVLGSRYGDGFKQVPLSIDGVPTGGLSFRLLIALTKDGQWVQFSQTAPRLFQAMMTVLDLGWMFSDPKWKGAPDFDDQRVRTEFWEILLTAVRAKTLAEWREVFDQNPDVWAECFGKGPTVLDHPQIVWNRQVTTITDVDRGPVRQPAALVIMEGTPVPLDRSAPRPDEHGHQLRQRAADPGVLTRVVPGFPGTTRVSTPEGGRPPLDGVTVLELGTYYAAPFGATLLAEMGARVIKVEQLDGDPMRNMLPFPEIAGIKALQGKESLAVDVATDAGRTIVYELAREADVVLQSFRAGVAERLRLDPASLHAVNPNLVYLSAPGYGTGGPNGHRPAYAPTIGAAAGLAWRNAGSTIPEGDGLSLDEVKGGAMPLAYAVMGVGNCDGFASVAVGTAMVLGLLARQRGAGGQAMLTTMLGTATHALCEATVTYDGAPDPITADTGLHGFAARYRLYECAEGWLFLAAPMPREWTALAGTVAPDGALAADGRFATEADRADHDDDLAAAIQARLLTRGATEWEAALSAVDIAAVEVVPGPLEANFMDEDKVGQVCGLVTHAHHPMLEQHPRLTPLVTMSRSGALAGNGCLVGEHTEQVMHRLGYTDEAIAALRADGVLGG